MSQIFPLLSVTGLAFLGNIPLGMWRERCHPLSVQWFFAVHACVPIVVISRRRMGLNHLAIPFTLAAAVAGQVLGPKMYTLYTGKQIKKRDESKDVTVAIQW
eukprot:CFRG7118T1